MIMDNGTMRIMDVAEEINRIWGGGRLEGALSVATTRAGELGYAVPMGTGAKSPEALVSMTHGALIVVLAVNTTDDGVFTGDMEALRALAAEAGETMTVELDTP